MIDLTLTQIDADNLVAACEIIAGYYAERRADELRKAQQRM
jgi:tellurite resistance protein